MSTKNSYYAYFLPKGESKIVSSWIECEKKVKGIKGARFKGFKTLAEARGWLVSGAKYETKIKKKMPVGIYFDAGTGRGQGVEVSITDKNGEDILNKALHQELLNKYGKLLLSREKTNNYGELLACYYAIKLALSLKKQNIYGDSKLVIDFWSKGMIKKEVSPETRKLAFEVVSMRREFESNGGNIILISGGDNPADLGFHK